MKKKKRLKKKVKISFAFIILIGVFLIFNFLKTDINIKKSNVEIGDTYKLSDLISVRNGTFKDKKITFDTLGSQKIEVNIKGKLNKSQNEIIKIRVSDTTNPTISGVEDKTVNLNSEDDLLEGITIKDNSGEDITPVIKGTYDLKEAGEYNLKVEAEDSSGNKASENFILTVEEEEEETTTTTKTNVNYSGSYYVKINRQLNVVMVYSYENGKIGDLVKTFLCSTGEYTPVGTFKTLDRYETLSLVGGVWGHYTLRIVDSIFFHSVPYFTKPGDDGLWDDLEYEEYNKLGTKASKGCIRLAVIDAKWIYENLDWQTIVEIYDSDVLPEGVVKPALEKIDVNSKNRGWDPTDPDENNPWNN